MASLKIFLQGLVQSAQDMQQQMHLTLVQQRMQVDAEHSIIGIQVLVVASPHIRIDAARHSGLSTNGFKIQATSVDWNDFLQV